MTLDGVAVVTGAGGSIGGAVARRLLAEGARIAAADVDAAGLERLRAELGADPSRARTYQVDLSLTDEVTRWSRAVLDDFGQADFLLNVAGGDVRSRGSAAHPPGLRPIETLDDDDWVGTLQANLTSAFLCCRAFTPHLKERQTGRIVNFASFATRHGSNRVGVHYAAAKGGIVGLTKTLALELGPFGVAVNALAPGDIPGERRAATRAELFTAEQEAALLARIPLGRVGTPDEIASVVAVLCSEAGSYVTGMVLDVNGGLYIGP